MRRAWRVARTQNNSKMDHRTAKRPSLTKSVFVLVFAPWLQATVSFSATPTATRTPAKTPTPKPTLKPTPTPTRKPTPTPTPAAECPAPVPALYNPKNPVSYGADSTGIRDSSAAFKTALGYGDLDVPGGIFLINSTVMVPNGRRIKCEPGALLKTSSTSNYVMFRFDNNYGGGVWNCRFAGTNYNLSPPGYLAVNQHFIFHQSIGTSGSAGKLTIANNDFNGINGYTGAVTVYASDANQPPPNGDIVTCNTAENCGYDFVQLTSARNTTMSYNTTTDCAGWVEADDTKQINTGNVAKHNSANFKAGVGYANHGGGNNAGWNHITCGASCSGSACNYSGNTCSYNTCGGSVNSGILQSAVGGSSNNAVYIGNTIYGLCTVH